MMTIWTMMMKVVMTPKAKCGAGHHWLPLGAANVPGVPQFSVIRPPQRALIMRVI
jgi:hypothetical protein